MAIVETLVTWDKQLFLTINGWHNPWMDHFMWLMSETVVWLPFFLVFLYYLIKNHASKSLLILLTLGLLITFTDQIASGVFKPLVERLRPTHDPSLVGMVHTINHYAGGRYGFFSSHAANVFAFAGLSIMLIRQTSYSVFILIWASLISYSRIYLGVHFPLDVLTGAVFGLLSGFGFHSLYHLISKGKSKRMSGKKSNHRKTSEGFAFKEVLQLEYVLAIILIVTLLSSKFLTW